MMTGGSPRGPHPVGWSRQIDNADAPADADRSDVYQRNDDATEKNSALRLA